MLHQSATSCHLLPDFSIIGFLQSQRNCATPKIYRKLDVEKRQIRLVSILPGSWSDDVACELTIVSLDDNPSYEALSYTWGDPSDTVPILLQGLESPVTKPLHLALRRLRHVGEARRMWVDALCINQSDSKSFRLISTRKFSFAIPLRLE